MIATRRPAGLALVALMTMALAWPIAAWSAASGESADAREAARLVARTRDATEKYDFSATATVSWNRGARHATVEVRDARGAIEIVSDDGAVVDEGRHTYVRGSHDAPKWTGVLVEPIAAHAPSAASHWDLSTRPGRMVAGRAATVVLAARVDGTPALRLFVDDETGLLLGREVLGADGRVERSVKLDGIDIAPAHDVVETPRHVETEDARPLRTVPSGYRAPASISGYDLLTRSRHPDGVSLFYSDGIFTVSVFEQQGELDWGALPNGGTTRDVAGTRARSYQQPSGNVVVWERDGLVYTCVSDAPSDVFAHVVDTLAGGARSAPESVVDFVLGPFGWS